MGSMPSLEAIRRALAAYEARALPVDGRRQAAVSLVLRGEPERPEVLFIERARHPADPWSGHMAFPGGRMDPGDVDARAAAERETLEEVGLSLDGSLPLGRLNDLEGHHAGRAVGMVISAWVYHVAEPGALVTNHEVEEALWVPLDFLVDPERHLEFAHPDLAGRRFRGIVVGVVPTVTWSGASPTASSTTSSRSWTSRCRARSPIPRDARRCFLLPASGRRR
jgi:8-oxo-dGTP pyrophosphatase MutT (NUDIX family)